MIPIGILAALLTLLVALPVQAQGEQGLARAIGAQEAHTDRLLNIQGVVGTAVGLGADGKPVILILTEAAGVAGPPRSLDGVRVVVKVTGKLFALGHCPEHTGGKPPLGCGNGDDGGTPGITVNPTSGLVTTEDLGTDTFTVVIDTQPTADVTIDLTSDDITEGTVSPTSLTFTSGDWDSPQTVTVTGVDDNDVDGDVVGNIAIHACGER